MKIAAYQFEISQDILKNYSEIENAIILDSRKRDDEFSSPITKSP